MFHQSRNVRINGGTFNSEYHGPVHISNNKSGMQVLLKAASPGAFHNSGERFDPPKCYQNTRVAVLSKVMDWIIGTFGWEEYIMWLYGPAGAGKSAIAQTIADMCYQDQGQFRILLASFFFSRLDPKRNSIKHLGASLAYQVAANIPEVKGLIESVVVKDPAIFDRSFKVQFNDLILKPLMQLYKTSTFPLPHPYLIVIDGLDECNDTNSQRHILDTISDGLAYYKNFVHLIVLLSSRTERDISLTFANPTLKRVTSHLALDDAYHPDSDIRRYLEGSFSQIKTTRSIPAAWPSDTDISSIVTKSSGQFIYAATVVRYISSSRNNPTKSLEIILGLRPVRKDMPFAELDALYSDILSRVEDIDATLQLLGAILLSNSGDKSTKFMEGLMLLDEGDATRLLADLSSIIMVDEKSEIRVLHASLGDFLLDQARSNEYHINPAAMFTELSHIGLHHISHYTPGDVWFAYWWFEDAEDLLFRANPTDELREMVLKTPFIQCIYSILHLNIVDEWLCDELVGRLLMGLKTSGFSNTDELYLYHRGVWDKILHERLSKIKSGRMVDAIISSAFIKDGGIHAHDLARILAEMFGLEICIPLMVDNPRWFEDTLYNYIGPPSYPGYQKLLLEFLADPVRAGKYILDGTKFATLTKVLLEFLIQSRNDEEYESLIKCYAYKILGIVEEIIPWAAPYPELVEMLNNSALILPYQCHSNRYTSKRRDFRVTVRTFANYLARVCGSVPPGFRITVKEDDGEENISYYYDANSDDEYDMDSDGE